MGLQGATRLLSVGVVITVVAVTLVESTTTLAGTLPTDPIEPFSLPAFDVDVSLAPPFERLDSEGVLERWFHELAVGLLAAGLLVFYYVTLALLAVGLAATGVGLHALVTDEAPLRERLRRSSRDRSVRAGAVAFCLLWLIILNPWLIPLVAEVAVVLVVGGSVFAASVGSLLAIYDHRTPARTVLVMYPLGLAAVLLSLIAAGLASPAFNAHLRAASTVLAIWLLDNVLAVGGLNALLRRQFQLEGVGFFLMWLAIDVVLGWVVGAAALAVGYVRERTYPTA
jgi:MFS family permease